MKAYRRSQARTDARSHATGDFDVFSAQDLGVDVSFMRAGLQGQRGRMEWRPDRRSATLQRAGRELRLYCAHIQLWAMRGRRRVMEVAASGF